MKSIKPGTTEVRHLRYFLAVIEAGSFRQAARNLHVSQPTLSQQIQQLELQFEALLFERVNRRVRLTAAGEILREHAVAILGELSAAKSTIAQLDLMEGGQLRVGMVSTINITAVPEAVSHFHQQYPKVGICVRALTMEQVEKELIAGQLDVGIGFLSSSRQQGRLETVPLFEERLVAVVPVVHPLAKRKKIALQTLLNEPLVLLCKGFYTRELIEESIAAVGIQSGFQAKPRVEMNSIEGVLATVKHTGAITLLPDVALTWANHPEVVLVPLMESRNLPHRQVCLLWARGTHRAVAARAFASELLRLYKA